MAKCIKTGAWCFVREYNSFFSCDVHKYRNTIIIRLNPNGLQINDKADIELSIDDGFLCKDEYWTIVVDVDEVEVNNEYIRSQL